TDEQKKQLKEARKRMRGGMPGIGMPGMLTRDPPEEAARADRLLRRRADGHRDEERRGRLQGNQGRAGSLGQPRRGPLAGDLPGQERRGGWGRGRGLAETAAEGGGRGGEGFSGGPPRAVRRSRAARAAGRTRRTVPMCSELH